MGFDIIGIGCSSVDYIGIAPEYPPLDLKIEMEGLTIQGGGPAATAMVTAARLGASVSLVSAVGDDQLGRIILDELAYERVDTGHIITRPGASSHFSFIVVDKPTGKRNVFWTRAGLAHIAPDELDREHILSAKLLHVDNIETYAALQASRWANDAGIPVLMDAGSLRPGVSDILPHVDYLIASHRFAQQYLEEPDPMAAAETMRKGRTSVSIVTCGDQGSYCASDEGSFHTPAFEVDAVDTTGAGDVFHGAFSFGIVQGWDLRTIIRFASAAAAIKCTQLGGRPGIPTIEQVREFLGDNAK